MSAIAGVVHLDGRPIDRERLQRIADALHHRAPDGTSIWRDGCAGLVHGRLIATPEAARERQPLGDPGTGLAMTFDGRLDNRAELLRALDIASSEGREIGDAELTLRAYRAWGEASVERLLGDFAFAIWDAPRRTLFCARDVMGIRPFCYRVDRETITFATDIGVLAACAGEMPSPNEGMAAEYLACAITSKRETLFQGIFRLPPAHVLVATSRGIVVRRYWQPNPNREIRYNRNEDYAEHLAALVRDGVAARLRTRGPVGIMLSGGVDSSSVTGVAVHLRRAGAVPCTGIEAFSMSMPGPKDERAFFEQVVDWWKLPGHRFDARLPRPGQFRDEIARDFDIQTYPHGPTLDPLHAAVRDRGARILLTGVGGDEWLGTSPWAYADLLRSGRLGAFVRRVREDAALEDFVGWRGAAKSAIWPLVPSPAKRLVSRAYRRVPDWIDPAFAARIDLEARLRQRDGELPFPSAEQFTTLHEGTNGSAVHSLEMFDRSGARFGVEHWHPFLDRRIVEFGLAMPADQRWRDGRAKHLLRRAMAPHLPPAIAERVYSPDAAHALVQAIDAEGGALRFDALRTERLGWINGPRVRARHQRLTALYHAGDTRYPAVAWTLWLVLAMEMWLDVVTASPRTAAARRATETVVQ